MNTYDLYKELTHVLTKPNPFSVYTADMLWADHHTSQQMLKFHLNPEIDVSSRRVSFIDESVEWMIRHFNLSSGSRVIDYGCGPGLYTSRLASCGAKVTGIDFSPTSISYAREQAESSGFEIAYHQSNYLNYKTENNFDLIIMIMCDLCALSPAQRAAMYGKFANSLSENGRLVFDVYSLAAFDQKQETIQFGKNLLDGFWSSAPYYGFLSCFKYVHERVSLDKYIIIEEQRRQEVYNWLQYFSPESLKKELLEQGLDIELILGNVAGDPYDEKGTEFAVVVKKE